MTVTIGTSGYPPPQLDSAPAVNQHVQSLVAKRDQLATINASLSRRLATLRDGVAVLAERIKERE